MAPALAVEPPSRKRNLSASARRCAGFAASLVALATASARAAPAAAPACEPATDPLAAESLAKDVRFFAAPALDGRAPATAGDLTTRDTIARRFACQGLTPGADDGGFQQAFVTPPGTTANVVAYLPGTDAAVASEVVLIMAHHDHLGAGHLGANDNASGLAAMLAVAQVAVARGPRKRTLAFVAFGAEEQGLLGSSFYLAQPPAALPLARTVYVVNLDMIGSYSARRRVQVFGATRGQRATSLLQKIVKAAPRTRFALGGQSDRGDHAGFAALGIPYAFFWTPDGRCYHRRCDTAERVDYPHLADITRAAAELALALADE